MISHQIIATRRGAIAISDCGGNGSPLLLIHGNSSCREIFRQQLDSDIGRQYRLIAMDLPGHGESENAANPAADYTIVGYADTAAALLEALQIDRCAVLGWSLGGHIGIEMIALQPAITALMISGTPPIGRNQAQMAAAFLPSEHMALTGQEHLSDSEAEQYARATCGGPTVLEPFLLAAVKRCDGRARTAMVAGFAAGLGVDQQLTAQTLTKPLAIVMGAQEPFVNNRYIEQCHIPSLWQQRVHQLAGLGHAPFWEDAEQFNVLLKQFLVDLG